MKRINGAALSSLINSVHLGGIIDEAVLSIYRGEARIQAVDKSNCLFVSNVKPLEIEDMKIGITEIGLLSKILNGDNEVQYELSSKKEKQWMKFKIKNIGNVKLLLTPPEHIPTSVEDEEAGEELLSEYEQGAEISKESISKIMYLIDTFKPKSLVLKVHDNGKVLLTTSEDSKAQFKTSIAIMDDGIAYTPMHVEIYTDHFISVLKFIKDSEEPIEIDVKDDSHPAIITSDNCIWAFSPINTENEEE